MRDDFWCSTSNDFDDVVEFRDLGYESDADFLWRFCRCNDLFDGFGLVHGFWINDVADRGGVMHCQGHAGW